MLNQIIPAGAVFGNICNQLADNVKLMITREYKSLFCYSPLLAVVAGFPFCAHLQGNKLLDNIQHTVFLEYIFPQIRGRIAARVCWIACAAIVTSTI